MSLEASDVGFQNVAHKSLEPGGVLGMGREAQKTEESEGDDDELP